MIALQESLDRLWQSVETLGKLRPTLGREGVRKHAIDATIEFLQLPRGQEATVGRDVVVALRELSSERSRFRRAKAKILRSARQAGGDPRTSLRDETLRYLQQVEQLKRPVAQRLDPNDSRHRAFLKQMPRWARHIERVSS